jgi:hypothetical protein
VGAGASGWRTNHLGGELDRLFGAAAPTAQEVQIFLTSFHPFRHGVIAVAGSSVEGSSPDRDRAGMAFPLFSSTDMNQLRAAHKLNSKLCNLHVTDL